MTGDARSGVAPVLSPGVGASGSASGSGSALVDRSTMVVDGGSGSAAASSGGVGTLRTTTGSATSFVRTKDDGIGH
eukprot:5945773-Karenia_brevis.AAC.1